MKEEMYLQQLLLLLAWYHILCPHHQDPSLYHTAFPGDTVAHGQPQNDH